MWYNTVTCYHLRYHELFYMIDTCQAESMFQKFYSPNILAVASSKVGEDSLSVSIYIHVPGDHLIISLLCSSYY